MAPLIATQCGNPKGLEAHACGCRRTTHVLPKLVSFLKYHGDHSISYSNRPNLPLPHMRPDLGIESACPQCQISTGYGIITAITSLHCGPDSLVDHEGFAWLFFALIDLRLKEDPDNDDGEDDNEGDSFKLASGERKLHWDYIWDEFTRAFELRRDRINTPEILRDLSLMDRLRHKE
ncbi:hypothetical protein F5Y18DRAFT_322291 [Xylariaceae sp. FL1019]|nr:hypothetical protein F5Y18DRAFT_322291 [Xylariaceae sp. FL1019]